ncbi:hypothetical protein N752_29195 [Desulforamulus aquiferis]|nr:putative phage tail protein [Desulforamulus aquiferis]RYD01656.1 hypothetical protein N752_29195 [Desulforamulus aquiferis]
MDQFFAPTATWALDIWEQELGLTSLAGKPIEQRRSLIISKLRGIGTITTELIKTVSEAYDGGTVEVTEQPEIYQISVEFFDTTGVPQNLLDLKGALEEIKPAHLAIRFIFKYLLIRDIHETMTINELQSTPLHKFAGGGY